MHLSSDQQQIIRHVHGAAVVLAPAGTGKTTVMAERLAYAAQQDMPLSRTLCVTFTNRAANEMRARVEARLGKELARSANIHTFHGLCAWILKLEANDLGMSRDFIIYDEEDCTAVIASCLPDSSHKPNQVFYQFSEIKSNIATRHLQLRDVPPVPNGLAHDLHDAWMHYHQILTARNAIDFSDLILKIRAMFHLLPEKRKKWERRFDWIQVDEIQDTHQSEYEVMATLADQSGNLTFFGDLDQTIYEWRGSAPNKMLKIFHREFAPVQTFSLKLNYRATKSLLTAADRLADTFIHRYSRIIPAPELPQGEPITIHQARTTSDEATWIANQILDRQRNHPSNERIGILARTHARCLEVSKALTDASIHHVTVEQYQFFLRQEIKDVLARLRLLINPSDTGSLVRMVRRPAVGIGDATLRSVAQHGEGCALRLTDLLRKETHSTGEPFGDLLHELNFGEVVVLDVETTGLSAKHDEIIDIGAVRLRKGVEIARFDELIQPSIPVGDSEDVHGLSDDLLRREGGHPNSTLAAFRDFVGDAIVVGHNVGFDLSMLQSHGARVGVNFQFPRRNDTLDIARRVLHLERYTLEVICEHLNTRNRGSHRAITDTVATAEVLLALKPSLESSQEQRVALVRKFGNPFRKLAKNLTRWQQAMESTRPASLLEKIIEESGLATHYVNDPVRLSHFKKLTDFFKEHDNPESSPAQSLADIVAKSALARNIDHLGADDTRIPIITVHQAKGLEFDVIFIAGASEGEFPSYFAVKGGDLKKIDEDRRLFYVALTRAKRKLYISSFRTNDWNYPSKPSRFLSPLT